MFSRELGIDVDAGAHQIERWFLAATLFGHRISTAVAIRTYRVLSGDGVATIGDVAVRSHEELIALLDAGGYARYDISTAHRLRRLAEDVGTRFPAGVARWGARCTDTVTLVSGLESLPGWGPVTVHAFLRELRGRCAVEGLPVGALAHEAARTLGLGDRPLTVASLTSWADRARVDPRDLEAALIRVAIGYRQRAGSSVTT